MFQLIFFHGLFYVVGGRGGGGRGRGRHGRHRNLPGTLNIKV